MIYSLSDIDTNQRRLLIASDARTITVDNATQQQLARLKHFLGDDAKSVKVEFDSGVELADQPDIFPKPELDHFVYSISVDNNAPKVTDKIMKLLSDANVALKSRTTEGFDPNHFNVIDAAAVLRSAPKMPRADIAMGDKK